MLGSDLVPDSEVAATKRKSTVQITADLFFPAATWSGLLFIVFHRVT